MHRVLVGGPHWDPEGTALDGCTHRRLPPGPYSPWKAPSPGSARQACLSHWAEDSVKTQALVYPSGLDENLCTWVPDGVLNTQSLDRLGSRCHDDHAQFRDGQSPETVNNSPMFSPEGPRFFCKAKTWIGWSLVPNSPRTHGGRLMS